jgi:hypothetical protein
MAITPRFPAAGEAWEKAWRDESYLHAGTAVRVEWWFRSKRVFIFAHDDLKHLHTLNMQCWSACDSSSPKRSLNTDGTARGEWQ